MAVPPPLKVLATWIRQSTILSCRSPRHRPRRKSPAPDPLRGTASILNEGTFSYSAQDPTVAGGPTTITTGLAVQKGTLITQSPQFSYYEDMVVGFNLDMTFTVGVGEEESLPDIKINVNQTIPLVSINAQQTDSSGNFLTNPSGTPLLDGQIKLAGINALLALPSSSATKTNLNAMYNAEDAIAQSQIDQAAGADARGRGLDPGAGVSRGGTDCHRREQRRESTSSLRCGQPACCRAVDGR